LICKSGILRRDAQWHICVFSGPADDYAQKVTENLVKQDENQLKIIESLQRLHLDILKMGEKSTMRDTLIGVSV
jgi:predicted ATPase